MTLRHLEIFAEVRQTESITKAAEHLNMAQPAVSRSIRELENYYGVRLFERMNRKLYVTEAGEQLFSYADAIISQYYEAKDALQDRELTAKLRIGSNISCAQKLMPELLRQFVKAYPTIPVFLKVANSYEIEKELLSNKLDFGIMDLPRQPEAFVSHKIREDAVQIICAQNYPIADQVTFEQFKSHPLLVRESGSGSRQLLEHWFSMEGARPDIVMESSDVYSLQEICRSGFGLLVLTESMAGRWANGKAFRTIEVSGNRAKRSYCLVSHKCKYLTRSMRLFKEYAQNYFSLIVKDDPKTGL